LAKAFETRENDFWYSTKELCALPVKEATNP
jgi:hypothetical protein